MECLRIGIDDTTKEIADQIVKVVKFENNKNIEYKYKKSSKKNKLNYLDIFFKTPFNKILRAKFGELISEWIIHKYENKIILKIINKKCAGLTPNEKNEILIDSVEKNESKATSTLIEKREEIKNKLTEYFKTSNQIFVEGFVRFRLKEYWNELEKIVDSTLANYKLTKEYNSFIKLLQYFVQIQPSKMEFMHIIPQKNGSYTFHDKLLTDITEECKKDFINEIITKRINYDDFLISSLIVMSPKKIVIHQPKKFKNKELLLTIIKVFGKRINFCKDCTLCRK